MSTPSLSLAPTYQASAPVPVWERAFALGLAIASLPLLVVLMLCVRVLSGRSPLVAHLRVGYRGEPLWMLKLRTMWGASNTESMGLVERLPNTRVPAAKAADVRVTSRFAAWCRRLSLDELPQLWHIVRGEMCFVGPRPITSAELESYYGVDAEEVLLTVPGLTGLWQTMGRNRLTYAQRRRLDLFFVRRKSPSLCAWVLLRTPSRVLFGDDAW